MGPGVVGGLVGGGAVFTALYGYYYFSGAKTAVDAASTTKAYFQSAKSKIAENTPEPNQAIEWLHKTALAYAGFVPGASGYIDAAFKDLESVRAKHGDKVDAIVKEAYDELKQVSKEGDMSFGTAQKVWSILEEKLRKIGELAGDAVEDILDNHPDIKDKVGDNVKQLRQYQDKYGPQFKEEVDKTWQQVAGVVQKGVSVSTVPEIKRIIEEKMQQLRKLGDEAYNKGLEQAKPYLEKSPKVKQLVEENTDALKQGNVQELWERVKKAVESGSTEDFEKYVQSAKEKVSQGGKSLGFNVDKYLQQIPGSSEVMSKLSKLQEVGQKHGPEAEKLFKSTIDEIKQVLQKKTEEAQKVADKAKKESSS